MENVKNSQNNLKEAASSYYEQGLNIVPVQGKKPLVEWARWQTKRQTQVEFDGLPWGNADGFALICGMQAANGMYIAAIDTDNPDFDLKLLSTTRTERTPREGYHFIYFSRQNCRGHKEHDLKVELLGMGNLCIMAPSNGYQKLNDNLPTEIESIESVFDDLIIKLGGQPGARGRQPLTTVIQTQNEGNRNTSIFDLATTLRDGGVTYTTALIQCLNVNKGYKPPLPETEVETTVKSAYEHPLQEVHDAASSSVTPKDFFDDDGNFEPVKFAKYLLSQYHFKTTRDNKTIYIYNPNTGTYTPMGTAVIHTEMSRHLDDKTRKHYYADVEFYIQGVTFFDRPQITPNKIACLNGILNVEIRELEPFTPEQFILTQIPITFAPDADCPKIKKFLSEVVNQDQLCMMQETIGYCLYQGMPIHKATMLVGDGANGKSTLIELVKLFLGADNVSNVSLQSLCENRFAPAALYGKLANLFADLPDKSLTRTGMFKMLSGNDTIMGEEKFKQLFSFKNYAKQMYSCNQVPETRDDTIAFFRRWNIIMCPNRFIPGDPAILTKTATPEELSGLLNYALAGLRNVLDHTEFCKNETTEQIRSQYIRQSNSAKAYIEEYLEESLNYTDWIPEAELYSQYIQYCTDEKLLSMKKKDFTTNLKQYMPNVKQTKERIKDKPTDVYQFLRFTSVPSVPSVPEPLLKYKNNTNLYKYKVGHREQREQNAAPATTCPICLKFLPPDLIDCTTYDGKTVHMQCYLRLREGLRDG